jgi:hypothetical protein
LCYKHKQPSLPTFDIYNNVQCACTFGRLIISNLLIKYLLYRYTTFQGTSEEDRSTTKKKGKAIPVAGHEGP